MLLTRVHSARNARYGTPTGCTARFLSLQIGPLRPLRYCERLLGQAHTRHSVEKRGQQVITRGKFGIMTRAGVTLSLLAVAVARQVNHLEYTRVAAPVRQAQAFVGMCIDQRVRGGARC